jgi:V/A-type H+-transporting ATPase subunit E
MYSQNMEILSRVIMDDANKEAEAILEKAKRESVSIKEKGINIANDLIQKNNIYLFQVKLSKNSGKLISLAEFRARSEILGKKEEILKGILRQIQQKFFSLPERADYPEILKKLIINALRYLKGEGSEFVCRVNSRDQSLLSASLFAELGKKMERDISLDKTPLDSVGGVIVFRSDLRVLYDNSLEAIFERNRQQMRCMAAECIFGKV